MLTCLAPRLPAQPVTGYRWWNPAAAAFPALEGQAWPADRSAPFGRFPARARQVVPGPVWDLSQQSAGLLLRFVTTSPEIVVRYTVARPVALPHMPATGVSGVDLYALDTDGNWLWSAGKYRFRDTVDYQFTGLAPTPVHPQQGREYRLYLPLYNAVGWLEVGVPVGESFTPLPPRPEKPIVVYGTSIAQGACASRPGMAWTALLGRLLDRPLINLGFSGNGRLEPGVVGLGAEIDAAVFILDCLPNMTARSGLTPDEVSNRLGNAVRTLRQLHPLVPIVLTDHFGYTDSGIQPAKREEYLAINAVQQRVLAQLRAEGIPGLYRLPIENLRQDIDAMVDGQHPTDLGMRRYAEAYGNLLRRLLHQPVGQSAATRPRPQYRGLAPVAQDNRHRTAIRQGNAGLSGLIVLGDSAAYGLGNALKQQTGAASVLNLGVPGDQPENMLWRVYHDELTGLAARQVIVLASVANLLRQPAPNPLAGFGLLLRAIRRRQPAAALLVLCLRSEPKSAGRASALGGQLATLAKAYRARFVELSAPASPTAPRTESDYARLARRLKPYLLAENAPVSPAAPPAGLGRTGR